jgi:hypothetical protein
MTLLQVARGGRRAVQESGIAAALLAIERPRFSRGGS